MKKNTFFEWMFYIFFYTGSIFITLWREIGQIPPSFLICGNIFI